MSRLLRTTSLWGYLALVGALSAAALYFGTLWEWTPGAASLAFLVVPCSVCALTGHKPLAWMVGGLAGIACQLEAVAADPSRGWFVYVFSTVAGLTLLALSVVIAQVAAALRTQVADLEKETTSLVRKLYEQTRGGDEPRSESEEEASADQPNDDKEVDYPMLLLALQDVGRRVSMNLDLEALLPVIVSTARASLKCQSCHVYFWNGRDKTLRNALPPRIREQNHYVPRPGSGMAGWVLEHRQILTRRDVEADYNLRGLLDEDPEMPDAIAPLTVGGELLGLLVLDGVEDDSSTFVRLLYVLSNMFALGIKNAQWFRRIEEMARRDGLTGLLNHATFQQMLRERMRQALERGDPLAVVISDIDHFKKFNDTWGHQAGDHVLKEVARLWQAVLPDYAVIARYGGEEFICILPGNDLAEALEHAERLRATIESQPLDFEGRTLKVTASFGVACLSEGAPTAKDLVRLADEALYRAKQAGRNRVEADKGPLHLFANE